MTEEEKKKTEETQETTVEQPAKSSIVKYIIMGLVGVLVVGGVAFGYISDDVLARYLAEFPDHVRIDHRDRYSGR